MFVAAGHTGAIESFEVSGTVYFKNHQSPMSRVNISVKGTSLNTITDINGKYKILITHQNAVLVASSVGFVSQEVVVGQKRVIDFYLTAEENLIADEEEVKELEAPMILRPSDRKSKLGSKSNGVNTTGMSKAQYYQGNVHVHGQEPYLQHNTEEYATIHENIFLKPTRKPLSTFSIDVDAASYSNVRRYLRQGQQPPKDAVRIEELVNYFTYEYQQPDEEDPFSVCTELSSAPWNPEHQLLHIGLQGRRIPVDNLPSSNLVFLIDVSGSMNSPNKLGLLKSAFKLLTNQLRPQDKVSMVVYAGAAGVVLAPTSGSDKQTILSALGQLQAGGSTAGGEGIKLAYKIAQEQFMEGGNNRIILATDGDFNIGASSNAEMERLIEKEREKGVFLTVLGFGMGNYKDSKMEILADKGNGNYAYIDDIMEAKKVLVNEFGGTLFTIAKDVKLQIEFNPATVKGYRLIGYENRRLRDEDFNDDKKDAGELGSGHTVTALYEIIPHDSHSVYIKSVDKLKYQNQRSKSDAGHSEELMTLKLRYKQPQGTRSRLITRTVGSEPVRLSETTDNFRWSAAVASFGMLLRDSEFKGNASYAMVEKWARGAQGTDQQGYRREFIQLVQSVDLLAQK
jgi:Ca-activated chloride channel family protein